MCQCEDRPCCGCDQENDLWGRYEPDPIDDYRESLEMDYEDEDTEDEDTETGSGNENDWSVVENDLLGD